MVVAGAGRGENRELFNGYGVSILQNEKGSGDWLGNNVNVLNTAELKHLKMIKMRDFYVMCILPQLKKNSMFFAEELLRAFKCSCALGIPKRGIHRAAFPSLSGHKIPFYYRASHGTSVLQNTL